MSALNLFFSTPVWVFRVPDYENVNNMVYDYIKSLQSLDNDGVVKSNIKGWHSKDFNLKEKIPQSFINKISPHIQSVINDMDWDNSNQSVKISNMWAIVNKGGAANHRHHHGNSDISAAYYVRAPKQSGEIVFYDPRPAPVFLIQSLINQTN